MKCKDCRHWERLSISDQFLPEDETGECFGLLSNGIEVELKTGMNGGYIKSIETDYDFFCANYEKENDK